MKQCMFPSAAVTQTFVPLGPCQILDLPTENICLPVEKCNNNVGYYFNHLYKPGALGLSSKASVCQLALDYLEGLVGLQLGLGLLGAL